MTAPTVTLRSSIVDGDVMLAAADILAWLRGNEAHWAERSPIGSAAAGLLADDLRDTWMDVTR